MWYPYQTGILCNIMAQTLCNYMTIVIVVPVGLTIRLTESLNYLNEGNAHNS